MAETLGVVDAPDDEGGYKLVYVGEGKYVFPAEWKTFGSGIYDFAPRNDDLFVMSLARSGTTVTMEIVWLLSNDLDFDNALKFKLEDRVPMLESSVYFFYDPKLLERLKFAVKSPSNPETFESVVWDPEKKIEGELGRISAPRVFKSHLPLSLQKNILKSEAKIVYVARNLKDRLVSQWRFRSAGKNPLWKCSFEEFWNAVRLNKTCGTPVWPHLREAWAQRNNPNVLFIFYEELRSDLAATIKKMAVFLGKNFTDGEIAKVADHVNIEKFRNNPMVNTLLQVPSSDSVFIGQGKVGGYKDIIPPHVEREIDEWIKENQQNDYIPFPLQTNCNQNL